MVTLQAKQQPSEHQQQQQYHHQQQQQQPQQQQQRRPQQREREAVVADDDSWKRSQLEIGADDDVHEYNRRCGISDDWTIAYKAADEPRASDTSEENRDNRGLEVASSRGETASTRSVRVAGGSNGESTQCSDIEDEDDVEIEEGLEEEEEEDDDDDDDDDENVEGGEGREYEVDEVDTDEDEDEYAGDNRDPGNQLERSDRWIKKKVVTTRVQRQTSFGGSYGQSEAVPHLDETTFGEVSVKNSKHVHVGNTNYYKGPVTIKQFVYTNAYPVLDKDDDTEGSSSARVSDVNPNDVPIVKCNPNGPILPNHRDYDYDSVTKWLWTWRCAAILCVTALSLVTIVAVVSVLLTKNETVSQRPPNNKVPDSPGTGEEWERPTSVRIIDRDHWNAQPPSVNLTDLRESPTPYVIISHTATAGCETQSTCVLRVRLIQTLHIESFGWDDIGYNFLVGGDGLAYLARGWDKAGSHAFGYNFNSMGISFIGTFNDVEPSKLQIAAAQNLIEYGMNLSKISTTYKLLGHRQVSKTLSPGDQLYRIIQSWEHWSSYPPPNDMSKTDSGTANRPHPAVFLPFLVIIAPYLLLLGQRSFRILFHAVPVELCDAYRYTHDMFYELR